MQVIEGTMSMIEATDHLKKAVGACAVEPIIETQGSETFVRFRVQHEVADADGIKVIDHLYQDSGPDFPDQCHHDAKPETDSDGVSKVMRKCGYPRSVHLEPMAEGRSISSMAAGSTLCP